MMPAGETRNRGLPREELAYLAVTAALRQETGVPFHVQMAKHAAASREEIISAILVGLPAAGSGVTSLARGAGGL